MKKILFVMESLRIGGAEKSLVTILSLLDKNKYDISLYLFRQEGAFMNQIPQGITVIPVLYEDKLQKNFKTDWITYFLKGNLKRSFYSLKWLINCFISKYIKHEEEYIGWEIGRHLYSDIPGLYDVAIGFMEKKSTYFVVDHVKAKKKIAFMHTDYNAIPHDKKLDEKYYKNLDYLVAVSAHTKEIMLKHFPFMKNKIEVIKNMVSPVLIQSMAKEAAPEMDVSKATLKLTTVGRLTHSKNIDGAVRILAKLRESGIDAEWFIIGDGEERENLKKMILKYGLNDKFHLLGERANPYPYMKNCDIYVQPSRWEGYGITVAEAKALYKPIIVSDILEFREQIIDNKTGMIANDDLKYVVIISDLYNNIEKRELLTKNLKSIKIKQKELEKIYQIID